MKKTRFVKIQSGFFILRPLLFLALRFAEVIPVNLS